MITIDELKDRRENLRRRISAMKAIRTRFEGFTESQKEEFDRLREELDIVEFNLDRHAQIGEYLRSAKPYGGMQ